MKLYELLVIEPDVRGRVRNIIQETVNTFKHKFMELYTGFIDTLKHFDSNDAISDTVDRKEITDTVVSKIDYTFQHVAEYYDLLLKKEMANTEAQADLTVGTVTFAKDLPATFLLGLENRLTELREVLVNMPTVPEGIAWEPDVEKGKNIFRSKFPQERFKTKNVLKPFVMAAATDKHPAQVEKLTEVLNVGKYQKVLWDSRVTPAQKSEILGRFDTLMSAVKTARQKANAVDVPKDAEIGSKLFNYILNG